VLISSCYVLLPNNSKNVYNLESEGKSRGNAKIRF
jgi:hypothetical protein